MLVVGDHDFKIPSRHTQGRICHWSQSTDYHQDRTSANRLGAPTPLKRVKIIDKENKKNSLIREEEIMACVWATKCGTEAMGKPQSLLSFLPLMSGS
ncbi:unnamed protein product [Caenorhabditis auriculariae]|uniref:Uncharacterized protein n=1 Tax=Caenorhabditis auriculariae TaxID=2777116 RepID=A0A8S1H3J5_9PELO|nr:unnamed protein product [Caenorhabditis auriculariae]